MTGKGEGAGVGLVLGPIEDCELSKEKTRERIKGKRGGLGFNEINKSYAQSQIFTKLSLPPVTNLLLMPGSGLLLIILPGAAAGAQLTALTPSP